MKNIIIFGASGDTGKYFVNYCIKMLKESNSEVDYNLIAVGTRIDDYFHKLGITYIQIDISDMSQFGQLPNEAYAVVDLAGIMPARMKGYSPVKYIDVNIKGTLNILEYCKSSHVDRILFAQSFGDIKDYAEDNEVLSLDLPRKFSFTSDHTVYVISKNAAVDLIEHYHQMYGIKRFIFRLPTIYLWSPVDTYFVDGEERKLGFRLLIDKAINGDDISLWGNPDRKKDMIYVKDFCQMLYRAILVDKKEGYYNVGTGIGTTLLEQINGIIKVFSKENKKSKILYAPMEKNAPQYIMDITSSVNDLGYRPEYSYIEMLQDLKKHMESQSI